MQVTINPYHRSVTIDGVEIIQKILPYPDDANSLASITCDYNSSTGKITEVSGIHRYVNHYIEKEYYFSNLPKFINWFYAEQKAQDQAETIQQQEIANVSAAIARTDTAIKNTETATIAMQQEIIKAKNTIASLQSKISEIEQSAVVATANAVQSVEEAILNATGTLPIRLAAEFPKRSLIERCRDIVNVKDYGAIGDGIVDDSCAFEAAIDVAIAVVAPLYIPTGMFKIDKLPPIPAIGSGRILLDSGNDTLQIYHAIDLLFEPNGGIVRDPISGKYKVGNEPIDPEGPVSPINTQYILDNVTSWTVPFTGYYSIMLIGGGSGGSITKYSDTHALVQGGRSGTINHFFKYLTRDTTINISIGQGGLGYNEYDSNSDTSLENTNGTITEFDIYTSDNYPHRHYHTNKIATNTYAEMVGASLGGGWDTQGVLQDGSYYGAGGAALVDMQNNVFKVSNGHRGAVILLYCDTTNQLNKAIFTSPLLLI